MKTEYLITFESADCICSSVEKFKNLLASHDAIYFEKKDKIKFGGKDFSYKIAEGKLTDGSIYYDFTLEYLDIDDINSFNELLRTIRKVCSKISGRQIIILHDGVGEEYCIRGYPIVYYTENLMRKLISKFMAISVGYDWTDASTPKEVLESVRSNGVNKKEKNNFLHEVDFIQLSNFLFKKYTKSDASVFIESMKEKSDEDRVSVSEIRQYSPFTNWEKYFSKKVNCNSEYIQSKWEKLYEYRCRIAHCRALTKGEFDDLKEISEDICGKIQSALDSIGDLHVESAEREELAENLSGTVNQNVANFIESYNKLLRLVRSVCEACSSPEDVYYKHKTNESNIKMQSRYLRFNKNVIDQNLVDMMDDVQFIRNKIVHQAGLIDLSDVDVSSMMRQISQISSSISSLNTKELNALRGVDLRK